MIFFNFFIKTLGQLQVVRISHFLAYFGRTRSVFEASILCIDQCIWLFNTLTERRSCKLSYFWKIIDSLHTLSDFSANVFGSYQPTILCNTPEIIGWLFLTETATPPMANCSDLVCLFFAFWILLLKKIIWLSSRAIVNWGVLVMIPIMSWLFCFWVSSYKQRYLIFS